MMNFNIDFVTHHVYSPRPRTSRTSQTVASYIGRTLIKLQKKANKIALNKAFVKLLLYRKPKIQQFKILDNIYARKLYASFFAILRFSVISHTNQLFKLDSKLNYPISVIQRFNARKNLQLSAHSLTALKKNQRSCNNMEKALNRAQAIVKQYIRRNFCSKFFRAISANSVKNVEYQKHARNLAYICDSTRMRILFESFSAISIKTQQKNVVDLDKQKFQKRETAVRSVSKRNEVINEMKRKITTLKGQISQNQIANNKKKLDAAKQNGTRLIKKNQEMRIYQNNTTNLEYDIQRMEEEISRKYHFAKSREGKTILFQYIQQMYNFIYSAEDSDGWMDTSIIEKFIANSDLENFKDSNNSILMQNVKLKQIMTFYEGSSQAKKTESYISADNENSWLKQLIASLMRSQLKEIQREDMLNNASEIQSNIIAFTKERVKLKTLSTKTK